MIMAPNCLHILRISAAALVLSAFAGDTSAQTTPAATIALPANALAGYTLGLGVSMATSMPGYLHSDPSWPISLGWTAGSVNGRLQLRAQVVGVTHGATICDPIMGCQAYFPPSIKYTRSQFTVGPFPAGAYAIDVFNAGNTTSTPDGSASMIVKAPAVTRVNTPWIDYSDHWWNPLEPGWGMMVWHEKNTNGFMAAWFGYGTEGKPYWFTVQGGNWQRVVNGTAVGFRYSGPIFESAGPDYTFLNFDPNRVSARRIGTATIEFTDARNGTLSFTVDNVVTRTTRITRFNP